MLLQQLIIYIQKTYDCIIDMRLLCAGNYNQLCVTKKLTITPGLVSE